MPSKYQSSGHDRARFESLKEDIGEDPARWLDWQLLGRSDRLQMVRIRIRSIDYVATVRAWIAVERRLDRGPRDRIVELLERRETALEVIGERDERHVDGGHEVPPKEWYYVRNGERQPWAELDRSVGVSSGSRPLAVGEEGSA